MLMKTNYKGLGCSFVSYKLFPHRNFQISSTYDKTSPKEKEQSFFVHNIVMDYTLNTQNWSQIWSQMLGLGLRISCWWGLPTRRVRWLDWLCVQHRLTVMSGMVLRFHFHDILHSSWKGIFDRNLWRTKVVGVNVLISPRVSRMASSVAIGKNLHEKKPLVGIISQYFFQSKNDLEKLARHCPSATFVVINGEGQKF